MAKYRILRNSPHFPDYHEGEIRDLSEGVADNMLRRDPPLAAKLTDKEVEAIEAGSFSTPELTEAQRGEILKREAEQGAQMPDGPQAQNLTPAQQKEHEEKGLQSKEAKQAQEAKGDASAKPQDFGKNPRSAVKDK